MRGRKPVDLAALEKLMVGFSQLVAEQRWIKEIDINPLFASGDDLVALDARVILHDPKTTEDQLPKLAIRPYPTQYISAWKMKDGKKVTIRPIRPEDEPLHGQVPREPLRAERLSALLQPAEAAAARRPHPPDRICFNDYDREIALVAERKDAKTGDREILGVARLSKARGLNEGEFALLVSDRWQKQGLGSELLKRLVDIARTEKLTRVSAIIMSDNHAMLHVCKKTGFALKADPDNRDFTAEYVI